MSSTLLRLRNLLHAGRLSIKDRINGMTPYVGYPKNGNIGDELLYQIAQRYFPKLNFEYDMASRGRFLKTSLSKSKGYYFVGGGSLIFGPDFLSKFEKFDKLGLSPIFWGTGSRELPGNQSELERWTVVLRNSSGAVRGTETAASFQQIGLKIDAVGDMGFLVNLDFKNAVLPENYVVLVPRLISPRNPLLNALDLKRLEYLKYLIACFRERKMDVFIFLPDAADLVSLREWLGKLDSAVTLLIYRGETDLFMSMIQKARAVVSMRLHPGIFAYSLGVPTFFIEARAKYYDTFSVLSDKPLVQDVDAFARDFLNEQVDISLNEDMKIRSARFEAVRQLANLQLEYSQGIYRLMIG